jgi:TLD
LRGEFVGKLSSEWLRGKRFELLYRGSRDGMTPAAFHCLCDGKGPTLVLIAGQSKRQPVCVFGGYASKSWESSGGDVSAPDSFVFTVANPFGDGIVKMPAIEGGDRAMCCAAGVGPYLGVDATIAIRSAKGLPSVAFSADSYCNPTPGGTFGDPLGRGETTFTGAKKFTPLEVEVWRVY